jgi:hypothetical protein
MLFDKFIGSQHALKKFGVSWPSLKESSVS